MSKLDDSGASAIITVNGSDALAKGLNKALSGSVRNSDKVNVSMKREKSKLYIEIRAKNTRLLQSVMGTYLSAITAVEEIDKL